MKNINEIKSGLDSKQFYLEYMPTIDLNKNRCCGAEALVRWKQNGSVIPPMEFIPIIENSDLSSEMIDFVIRQVAGDLLEWLDSNEDIHVGINTPPDLIGRGGIRKSAEEAGLFPHRKKMIMEITERGVPDLLAKDTLHSYSGEFSVAVDDFGTGDLNILQLSELPVNIIKIDKFFIDQIQRDKPVPRILKGLVAFANALEVQLIAEGIETEEQVEVLKELGVDMAQGWFFSKSLTCDQFLNFYQKYQ